MRDPADAPPENADHAANDPELLKGATDADEDDEELRELVETAAIEAIKGRLPHRAVQLARLDYLAQKSDGAASLYAMFASWISSWKDMVSSVVSDLDPHLHWRVAQAHMLLPEHGADPQARRLVGAFILRVLDEGLLEDVDADTAMASEPADDVVFFYRNIFLGGTDVLRDCALIVLFMIKYAFYVGNHGDVRDSGPSLNA